MSIILRCEVATAGGCAMVAEASTQTYAQNYNERKVVNIPNGVSTLLPPPSSALRGVCRLPNVSRVKRCVGRKTGKFLWPNQSSLLC